MASGHNRPERLNGLGTVISQDPGSDSQLELIDRCPEPDFVVFRPDKGFQLIQLPDGGDDVWGIGIRQ